MRASNIDAFFHLAKGRAAALGHRAGHLVVVSSVSGDRGDWGQVACGATKAPITTFVRASPWIGEGKASGSTS